MGTLNNYSPLRYPGGKAAIAGMFARILEANGIGLNGTYCEPFAGGAGVALTLLLTGKIGKIAINDFDPCVAAFWKSIIWHAPRFIEKMDQTPVTIAEWHRQREIYKSGSRMSLRRLDDYMQLGFATFYLNRCNRAGILPNAGPIGGWRQNGAYKIDARFKKDVLRDRIMAVYGRRSDITFTSLDALMFLEKLPILTSGSSEAFLYLDPPYYEKGDQLYLNFYTHEDHEQLSQTIRRFDYCPWIMTYDDSPAIRKMYSCKSKFKICVLDLLYSMQKVRHSTEILIAPKRLKGVLI